MALRENKWGVEVGAGFIQQATYALRKNLQEKRGEGKNKEKRG